MKRTAWNKGLKKWWNSPGSFQKGHTPWNKGKKGWAIGTQAGFQKGNQLTKLRANGTGKPWNAGKKLPKDMSNKISESNKGKHYYWLGKKMSQETTKKMSEARKGVKYSKETREKISRAHKGKPKPWLKGEKNPSWQGGKSFEPYTLDWEIKRKTVRKRDGYICQLCGKYPALDVHHIDYDKKNCNPENLITLCRTCHIKTNFNRDSWRLKLCVLRV